MNLPNQKQAFRMAFASSTPVVHARMVHDFHAEVAENRLKHEGVKPELLAYIKGIGARK
jgi:hypothetical protein